MALLFSSSPFIRYSATSAADSPMMQLDWRNLMPYSVVHTRDVIMIPCEIHGSKCVASQSDASSMAVKRYVFRSSYWKLRRVPFARAPSQQSLTQLYPRELTSLGLVLNLFRPVLIILCLSFSARISLGEQRKKTQQGSQGRSLPNVQYSRLQLGSQLVTAKIQLSL